MHFRAVAVLTQLFNVVLPVEAVINLQTRSHHML